MFAIVTVVVVTTDDETAPEPVTEIV